MTNHSPLATQVRGAVVIGADGYLVGVSAVSGDGLPGLHSEGLPAIDTGPARDRIRAAILNSGLPGPERAVTVSLTPLSLPKRGDSPDLAIALVVLAVADSIPPSAADGCLLFAALGLDGRLRPTPGIQAAAVAATAVKCSRLIVGASQADEADAVPDIAVTSCRTLAEVSARLRQGFPSPPALHAHRLARLRTRLAPLPDRGDIPQPPSGRQLQSGYATARRYASRGALYVAVNEIAEFRWRIR